MKDLSSEKGEHLSVSLETGDENQNELKLRVTENEVKTFEQSII